MNIKEKLKEYDFFDKEFEIYNIQDYKRESKFTIFMNNKYYTIILTDERIRPYINKIKYLGDNFKKIIGFKYLSNDEKILVLDYFGNNKGIDLVKVDEYINDDIVNLYTEKFKKIIDNIHANTSEYVDFSNNNFKTWKEYYINEISKKILSLYNQNIIDKNTKDNLMLKLKKSSNIYDNFKTSFIHADITPLNVCVNLEDNYLYLIDYDDFKIGDPLMDISRIINCKDMSKIFNHIVEKYYSKYQDNINHLFYTLRVNVNWYNHIIDKKQEDIYDLKQAKEEIYDVIKRILSN